MKPQNKKTDTGVKNLVKLSLKIMMILVPLLLSVSCGKDQTPVGEVRVITADIKELTLNFPFISPRHVWKAAFTQGILKELEKEDFEEMLASDLNQSDLELVACPGYGKASTLERRFFWVTFMASIAHAESSLNPLDTYRETNGTLSSGLLQIDLLSANHHSTPYTGFTFTQNDLFNPGLNLMSGLYIMKHQLNGGMNGERPEIKGRLFTDQSYYWSVLTRKRGLIIKTFTQNSRRNLGFCREDDR